MESTPYLYQTRFVYHNLHETFGPKATRQTFTRMGWTGDGLRRRCRGS
jgi:hypothetical protein